MGDQAIDNLAEWTLLAVSLVGVVAGLAGLAWEMAQKLRKAQH